MTDEERIARLEERAAAPAHGKDIWDRLSVIGSLLIPVAIFAVGQQYSRQMADAQIASEEARAASGIEVAMAGARVAQAGLVLNALESLAGENGPKKRLAIQAILIALPQDGARLVAVVSRNDPNPEIREYARNSLDQQKGLLIQRLYAADPQTRRNAAAELLQGWRSDPALVPLLAGSARRAFADPASAGRENGIYNVLVVLSQMNAAALAPHRDDLRRLAEEMRPVGGRTSERSDKLIERLPA